MTHPTKPDRDPDFTDAFIHWYFDEMIGWRIRQEDIYYSLEYRDTGLYVISACRTIIDTELPAGITQYVPAWRALGAAFDNWLFEKKMLRDV